LQKGQAYLHLDIDPNSEDYYISCIPDAVNDLLASEGVDISDIKAIFPPQVSSSFITKLADKMNIDKKRFIDITHGKKDLFNSSFPYAFEYAKQQNMVSPGDIGLIINISSGIQVGCAIYYL
jgi:3-oxoacyl-[acyl-carrier-protein] synthase III